MNPANMDEITQIVREIGQQQAHNVYYRDWYALFKHLQEVHNGAHSQWVSEPLRIRCPELDLFCASNFAQTSKYNM